MLLIKEIDERFTKKNVNKLLRRYRFLSRIAGEDYTPKVTATYSFMPKGQGGASRATETQVSNKVEAWYELEEISKAFNRIINPYVRQVLYERYCAWHDKRDKEIYTDLGYSETEFYRMIDRGLLEFAECYRGGELLVYRKSRVI